MGKQDKHFATLAVHAGVEPDPSTGAIMTPIFQTSTYVQDAPGKHKGFEYARTQNPTRNALEQSIATLEGGEYGICFSSGMAAMDGILKLLKAGDEVVATNDLYGGAYRLLTKTYGKFGLKSKFIDMTNIDNIKNALSPDTRLLWLETPTNPLLRIIDIEAVVKLARDRKILVCVDNTFASPYLQQPLALGADLVLHSATKYLAGHSDLVLGAVVTSDQVLAEGLHFNQNSSGAVPGPQDCFLTLRGLKTLHLRMQRASENAAAIANFLNDHPAVGKVIYPGLESHAQHALAKKQMRGFGGIVSFDLKSGNMDEAVSILSNTKLFALAESLGGVESLIGHPASMTHASIPRDERINSGLTDTLIRLSVGVEDEEDLIADLDHALQAIQVKKKSPALGDRVY